MVAHSTRTIGIAISSIVALGLIAIAYVISGPLPFHFNSANAASTHELLVAYAAKDTDSDGLPDWEEALYGTDPNNPHSVNANVTDGDAVAQGLVKPAVGTATTTPVNLQNIPGTDAGPQTVTDQFARTLFAQYLSQRKSTTPPTPEEIATFVEQGVANLAASQQIPDAFNEGEVRVVGTGSDALVSYAAAVETAFAQHTIATDRSEIDYYADAVEKNNLTSLKQVQKIGVAYTALAKAYVAVPVPKEAAAPHLAVANALAHLGSDITDMGTMDTDPLRSYFGLAKYQNDGPALVKALAALNAVYTSEQVVVADGAPGAHFYASLGKAASASTSL